MPGTTPSQPGWYADGDGGERWYDGNAWTDHVRGAAADESTVVVPTSTPATGEFAAADAPPPPNQPGAPAQLQVGKGLRIALAVAGALLLIAIAVVGGLVLMGGDDKEKDEAGDEASSSSTVPSTPSEPESSPERPTIEPSDFPSETATIPPPPETVEQSDFPTEFPTDFDIPTVFPTDPSDFASLFSDYLE